MEDPGFSRGGCVNSPIGIILQLFAENCMKMKEFGPQGSARPWRPSLDPPITFDLVYNFYRPQRSCGQGNAFTGVCLSRGGRGSASVHAGMPYPPGPGRHPPGPGRPPHPPDQADPPGKQTPAYGLRTAGTHPTGMHSCF